MKLGTENKTKTAIAGGLVIVAAFALYNWVFTQPGRGNCDGRGHG